MLACFSRARRFMAENGNPNQWVSGYPNEEAAREDIAKGRAYVMLSGGEVCGTFVFFVGEEPTYAEIDGARLDGSPYGVIHRIASLGTASGVFAAAGAAKMSAACAALAPIKTGQAAITPAFKLSARYVIHAVGPIYDENAPRESERLLYAAYKSALDLAAENGCESIAFPLISAGIYGYPRDMALAVAKRAAADFLKTRDMKIFLTLL